VAPAFARRASARQALPASRFPAYNLRVRPRLPSLLVLATVGLTVGGLRAHHSITGVYDSSNPVTIDGVISDFQFVNPHPFLLVSVKRGESTVVEWRLELDNRVELVDIGMTARTLARGDRIIARGSRGRENAASLYVMRLDRPADGFWYEQVGTMPRMRK
jgi:hypothetical protein